MSFSPPALLSALLRLLPVLAGRGSCVLLAVAICFWPFDSALAAPGDGIALGQGRLRLGAELLGSYDTKVGHGFFSGRRIPDPPDAIARIRGVADLELPGPGYRLDLDARLDWNQYLGVHVNTRPLSYFGADLKGQAVFREDAPLSLELGGSVLHSDRSATPVFGIGVLALHNRAHARLRARPGKGAFEFLSGYELEADAFAPQVKPQKGFSTGICDEVFECNPDLAAAYNSLTHRVGVEFRWKLFPRTGFSFASDAGVRHYMFGNTYGIQNVATAPIRASLGMATDFSPRLSLLLRGGWTALFFSDQDEVLHSWLGKAELSWRWTEVFQSRLGYEHSLEPLGGNAAFFARDRTYVDLSAELHRFRFSAMAVVDWIEFGRIFRGDLNMGANLKVDFQVARWLFLNAGAHAYRRISMGHRASTGAFSYNREELVLGVATLF